MFYHALTGNGGTEDLSPVLLWENSNPTAEFAAQTISLDLTDYVGVIIEFFKSAAENNLLTRIYVKKTDTAQFGGGFRIDANSTIGASGRNVTINDSGVEFTDGAAGWSVTSVTTLNTDMIPYRIYGVKAYVVSPAVGDLLWTNPAPSANFGAQKISIDLTNAKGVIIECMISYNTQLPNTRVLIYKGESPFGIGYSAGTTATSRNVTAVENDGVTFATGYTGASEDAGALIPYKIYAIN